MKREQKKKKLNLLLLLAPVLLFAAGAGIFLYPAVSNYLAERRQDEVIRTYQAQVDEMDQKALEAAWQEAIDACVPARFLELNKKAFALGRNA